MHTAGRGDRDHCGNMQAGNVLLAGTVATGLKVLK